MMEELEVHNQFRESAERFRDHDPHLKRLKNVPFIYRSAMLDTEFFDTPGVYLLTGGRQVGKTTFLKQYIKELLENKNVNPAAIFFITGEMIDSHHILRRMVDEFHDESSSHQYLLVDEVNYIPNWDKSIKFLADSGILDRMSVILTGSDSHIIRMAMKRFAGRRGTADNLDYEFHPLSFKEFVCLKRKDLEPLCREVAKIPLPEPLTGYDEAHPQFMELLEEYLLHGGYLPALNEYNLKNTIPKGVMNTYIHWIIGDILKYNKSENYLFEILKGIKATYNSQISWNNLGRYLAIEHHKTIADYCNILVSMHVLHIQEAIIEHKLTGAPKKNRKIYFRDPFIHHSVSSYLEPGLTFDDIKASLNDPKILSMYIEAVAVDHCKRWAPTFYIRGDKGEVDIALVQNNKMYPVEVKWTNRLRPEDFKQIQKYSNGIILTPTGKSAHQNYGKVVPFVRFLIHVSGGQFILDN